MLWVTFSSVLECVEHGLLELSFSDPAVAPGTPLLYLEEVVVYLPTWLSSFPLRLVGDRFLKADSSYTTICIRSSLHLLNHLYIDYAMYTLCYHTEVMNVLKC